MHFHRSTRSPASVTSGFSCFTLFTCVLHPVFCHSSPDILCWATWSSFQLLPLAETSSACRVCTSVTPAKKVTLDLSLPKPYAWLTPQLGWLLPPQVSEPSGRPSYVLQWIHCRISVTGLSSLPDKVRVFLAHGALPLSHWYCSVNICCLTGYTEQLYCIWGASAACFCWISCGNRDLFVVMFGIDFSVRFFGKRYDTIIIQIDI